LLTNQRQERQARPAESGQELVHIPASGAQPKVIVKKLPGKFRIPAQPSPRRGWRRPAPRSAGRDDAGG
jgi:hypothetical protein